MINLPETARRCWAFRSGTWTSTGNDARRIPCADFPAPCRLSAVYIAADAVPKSPLPADQAYGPRGCGKNSNPSDPRSRSRAQSGIPGTHFPPTTYNRHPETPGPNSGKKKRATHIAHPLPPLAPKPHRALPLLALHAHTDIDPPMQLINCAANPRDLACELDLAA